MSLIFAMPSPSGRNDAKLFVLRGRPDADPRAAFDAEPSAGPEGTNPAQIANWCKANLDADEIAHLCALLTDGNDAPATASDARPTSGLGSKRKPFGGSTATAEAEFSRKFPGSPRPRVL